MDSTDISLILQGYSPISAATACSFTSVRLISTTLSPRLASWGWWWENQKRQRWSADRKSWFKGELGHHPLGEVLASPGFKCAECNKAFWLMSKTISLGQANHDIIIVVHWCVFTMCQELILSFLLCRPTIWMLSHLKHRGSDVCWKSEFGGCYIIILVTWSRAAPPNKKQYFCSNFWAALLL